MAHRAKVAAPHLLPAHGSLRALALAARPGPAAPASPAVPAPQTSVHTPSRLPAKLLTASATLAFPIVYNSHLATPKPMRHTYRKG